ncbi:hypothetical protein GALMADRAFT_269439 [Galerina marginata CBS 339.88]|uniref:Ketoreductase (KR) domain-containing protein n=1 Tax=Galerina marginata (strain CBS 339.88) TaxID=685588 RepID=A0A067T4B5_GALM3|nr:hypothetical protein GALMADRAFT_269439 [Galerina marginata CBS 339.88]
MSSTKIVLVTGGNSGIGYEAVKALLESDKGYHVLLGSRSLEKAKFAIETLHQECPEVTNTVEAVEVDLASDESIEKAFDKVKASHGRVDALIIAICRKNGVSLDSAFISGRISLRDCFTKAYDVNVAGTQVLTWTFMPVLLKSADPRLIFVTGLSQINQASEAYFPTPPQPAGWPKHIDFETIGYRCSKTALNMLMLDWNHKLKEDGVKVWCVGPGFLATKLGNVIGGKWLRSVVEGERDADVGRIVNKDGIARF